MTDVKTPQPLGAGPDEVATTVDAGPADRAGRRTRPRQQAYRSRIAAVGIGAAAMVGLVGNMEIAGSRARSAAAASASSAAAQLTIDAADHRAQAHAKATAADQRRPIVLTPRVVVRSVAAPASGGSGGSGSSAAQAPATAPVASTSGSQ